MSKKIEILIILLLLIAIPVGLNFFSKSLKPLPVVPVTQTQKPQIQQQVIAETSLSFSPKPYNLASASGSLAITVATGSNKVTAAQLEISYDPTKLSNIALTPGTFFTNPLVLLQNIDKKAGKIFYAIAIQPTAQAKSGTGTLATLTFTSNLTAGQQTNIQFLPKTLVTAEGIRSSVLKATSSATIVKQ